MSIQNSKIIPYSCKERQKFHGNISVKDVAKLVNKV